MAKGRWGLPYVSRGPSGVNTRTLTNFVLCHRCQFRQATTSVQDPMGNLKELICDPCMDLVKRDADGRFYVVKR